MEEPLHPPQKGFTNMQARVEITPHLEKVYNISNGMTIGRGPKNDIQVLANSVSRNHAQFLIQNGDVILSDMGSSNGTKVNDQRITEQKLCSGDIIKIGELRIIFEAEPTRIAQENVFILDSRQIPEEQKSEMAAIRELGLVIDSTDQFLYIVRDIAAMWLEQVERISADRKISLINALREAMDNARRHGNLSIPEKKIELFFVEGEKKVSFTVLDEGEGFDYVEVLDQTRVQDTVEAARERYKAGGVGGLGIRLMLKCTDKIAYENKGSKLVLTTLKERFSPRPEFTPGDDDSLQESARERFESVESKLSQFFIDEERLESEVAQPTKSPLEQGREEKKMPDDTSSEIEILGLPDHLKIDDDIELNLD